MLHCKFCNERYESLDDLISHLKKFHPKRENLDLPCGETGCSKIFQSFGSRRLHITRHHRKFVKSGHFEAEQTTVDDSRDFGCRDSSSPTISDSSSKQTTTSVHHRKRKHTSLTEATDPADSDQTTNDGLFPQSRPRTENEANALPESIMRFGGEGLDHDADILSLVAGTSQQYERREFDFVPAASQLPNKELVTLDEVVSEPRSCAGAIHLQSEHDTNPQYARRARIGSLVDSTDSKSESQESSVFLRLLAEPKLPTGGTERDDNADRSSNTTSSIAIRDQKKALAFNLILNLRARNTSEPIIRSIINNTDQLIRCRVSESMEVVNEALLQHGIELNRYLDIEKQIQKCSQNFSDFDTKYKQDQYIRKTTSFVEPKRVNLDSIVKKGKQPRFGVNRSLQVQVEQLVYISIIDIIVSFMRNPRYKELLEFTQPSNTVVLRRFSDGSNFQNNELLLKYLEGYLSVPIFLYYDDINLTDTASNRPTKMAMFYFTFGNLKATYKSSTKFIYLVLSVEQDIFKSYPLATILRCIVKDLQNLENGVKMSDGSTIYGTLAAFLGDNLASHKIGGFKTGFTAEHPCRVCMATLDMVRQMVKEDPKLLRTVPEYDEMIQKLQNCKTTAEFDKLSKKYGLNENCPFNALKYFHAVNGIPPDIFHDIFEGSLALTLHLLLIHFLKGPNKVMSLDDFNTKMLDFDLGYSETEPSKILTQHLDTSAKLHQTGTQMWSLAVITPLILGPFVPLEDPFWENYTLLLEISMLVCGYSISTRMVGYLQIQIETYLRTFQTLYERGLIPKQHFLLHYVTYILRFGPLYNFITLRMEAKHQFFKEMMRRLKNLKNPSVTMAEQHQWYQVHVSEGFSHEDDMGPLEETNVEELAFAEIIPSGLMKVHEMAWLNSDGIKFIPGQCFVMTRYEDTTPEFCLVSSILSLNKCPILVCRKASTLEFDLHYFAYNIQMTDEYELKAVEQLCCPAVFHSHYVNGKQFIIVKRAVGDLY